MKFYSVETLMERYGYSRAQAEKEVKQATCEPHEYAPFTDKTGVTGTLCIWTPFGCSRTCVKCGGVLVDPDHCGQYSTRRATPRPPTRPNDP